MLQKAALSRIGCLDGGGGRISSKGSCGPLYRSRGSDTTAVLAGRTARGDSTLIPDERSRLAAKLARVRTVAQDAMRGARWWTLLDLERTCAPTPSSGATYGRLRSRSPRTRSGSRAPGRVSTRRSRPDSTRPTCSSPSSPARSAPTRTGRRCSNAHARTSRSRRCASPPGPSRARPRRCSSTAPSRTVSRSCCRGSRGPQRAPGTPRRPCSPGLRACGGTPMPASTPATRWTCSNRSPTARAIRAWSTRSCSRRGSTRCASPPGGSGCGAGTITTAWARAMPSPRPGSTTSTAGCCSTASTGPTGSTRRRSRWVCRISRRASIRRSPCTWGRGRR